MKKLYVLLIYMVHCVTGESVTSFGLLNHDETIAPKTCTMERVYKLVGYVCSNLNLKEIPQHLQSDFQVLDVSFNRIRELNGNSFERYTDIKYLYLFENMIQIIEANTFTQLTNLEVIDLSFNSLTTLPMELFSLPSLRTLDAAGNYLVNLHNDLKNISKPLPAPLRLINIAICNMNKIPDFGVLPYLWQLNISSNHLLDITPQQLSSFCGLILIDMTNTKVPTCTCRALAYYFSRRSITTHIAMNCDTSAEEVIDCPDVSNSTVDSEHFDHCTAMQREKKI